VTATDAQVEALEEEAITEEPVTRIYTVTALFRTDNADDIEVIMAGLGACMPTMVDHAIETDLSLRVE
jgi:hypothetical protein